jgi:ribose transport system substrate-binding protein
MKKASWILALVFGLAFLGATLMNASLIGKARGALSGALSGSPAAAKSASGQSSAQAGSPHSDETLRYQIVVVLPDTDDSFFSGLIDGVYSAAPATGAAVQVFRYPGADAQEAERYFEIALRARVDGLIMYMPRDENGVLLSAGRAEEAAKNGVIFIPVGTNVPPGEKGAYIGSGSLQQGIEGGKLIGRLLGSSARVGVILSSSDRGTGSDDPLYRGVLAALQAFRGALVTAVAKAQPGILSGEAVAEAMLRDHPEMNVILCSSARDTVGAAQVLVDLNQVGKVLIIGSDETPDILRYIDKGVIAASIVRDSRKLGEAAVKAFASVKRGDRTPAPVEMGSFVIKSKVKPK